LNLGSSTANREHHAAGVFSPAFDALTKIASRYLPANKQVTGNYLTSYIIVIYSCFMSLRGSAILSSLGLRLQLVSQNWLKLNLLESAVFKLFILSNLISFRIMGFCKNRGLGPVIVNYEIQSGTT
jgi:hypothetical protein